MAIDLVTTNANTGAGSLRTVLAAAAAGDTINFDPNFFNNAAADDIKLASILFITKNVTIEGHVLGGQGAANIKLDGQGKVEVMSVQSGTTATLDGLFITNGKQVGAAGMSGQNNYAAFEGVDGYKATGGLSVAGTVTITNSVIQGDFATGGVGGVGGSSTKGGSGGGGAGGAATGGIYVTSTGSVTIGATTTFAGNHATGGLGGAGGRGVYSPGGAGGAGAYAKTGSTTIAAKAGSADLTGKSAGGAPGVAAPFGRVNTSSRYSYGGGGGGGGAAFADTGGKGTITMLTRQTDIVTSNADSGAGSLRAVLAAAGDGDLITFSAAVFNSAAADDIKLASTLVIAKNVTIEGHVGGGTGAANIMLDGQGQVRVMQIAVGKTVNLDGLGIAFGQASGATGTAGTTGYANVTTTAGTTGGFGVGGIVDYGYLTLTNTLVHHNSATGGTGGTGGGTQFPTVNNYFSPNPGPTGGGSGGGAGGTAIGGIYVAAKATLAIGATDGFFANAATGGVGGTGGYGNSRYGGGAGGQGGSGAYATSANGTVRSNASGSAGTAGTKSPGGGRGGNPGQAGYQGPTYRAPVTYDASPGGGGGGGLAFADVSGPGTISGVIVACFVAGTAIATPQGDRAVETLCIGDDVTTADGRIAPVRWIGRRSFGGRFLAGQRHLLPVCITAGALADGIPARDLLVSPHHAMALGGVLVEAADLMNGTTIVQVPAMERVDYVHVELAKHDLILAEGAATETFVGDEGRAAFHNAAAFAALYPDAGTTETEYCLRRVRQGTELQAIRTSLALRIQHAA